MNTKTIYSVHIIFIGGSDVEFLAESVALTSNQSSYTFQGYTGNNNFTILEDVDREDIAYMSIEVAFVLDIEPEAQASTADLPSDIQEAFDA